MPTQGLLGFFINGKWYVIFNEFDSYPKVFVCLRSSSLRRLTVQGLGANVLKDIKKAHENNSFSKWRDQVPHLTMIDKSIPPTPEQQTQYSAYTNTRHGSRVCSFSLWMEE
jgi:hypothetical protein